MSTVEQPYIATDGGFCGACSTFIDATTRVCGFCGVASRVEGPWIVRRLQTKTLLAVCAVLLVLAGVVVFRITSTSGVALEQVRATHLAQVWQIRPLASRAAAFGFTAGKPAEARQQLAVLRLLVPMIAVAQGQVGLLEPRGRAAAAARAQSLRYFADLRCVAHNTLLADEAMLTGRSRRQADNRAFACVQRLSRDSRDLP
jgi:hypothetical protein